MGCLQPGLNRCSRTSETEELAQILLSWKEKEGEHHSIFLWLEKLTFSLVSVDKCFIKKHSYSKTIILFFISRQILDLLLTEQFNMLWAGVVLAQNTGVIHLITKNI